MCHESLLSAIRRRTAGRPTAWRRSDGADRENGQALVEFLLIASILIALVAATYEYSWYVHTRTVVAEAALQAARNIAEEGGITSDAVNSANNVLTGGDLQAGNATYTMCVQSDCTTTSSSGGVNLICAYSNPGSQLPNVTVTVSYDYKLLFPFLKSPLFLDLAAAIPSPYSETVVVPAQVGWLAGVNGPIQQNGTQDVCP